LPFAALYDIHGNVPALDAVLVEVRRAGVTRIVAGGDVVLGPMPRETLDRLLALDIPVSFIQGNCEREMLALERGAESTLPEHVQANMRWVAQQLGAELLEIIARWPATHSASVPGQGTLLFCHATPRNDSEIFTEATAESRLRPVFAGVLAETVVCGHTHMQFDRRIGSTRVVNSGSVGMPFGRSGADWLLIDHELLLRHGAYDLDAAAERVRESGYPQAAEFAERSILHPPSRDDVLAAFAKSELE
jgi:predicted phosphodiesterase